jgi:hypothetical protein
MSERVVYASRRRLCWRILLSSCRDKLISQTIFQPKRIRHSIGVHREPEELRVPPLEGRCSGTKSDCGRNNCCRINWFISKEIDTYRAEPRKMIVGCAIPGTSRPRAGKMKGNCGPRGHDLPLFRRGLITSDSLTCVLGDLGRFSAGYSRS